MAEIIEDGTQKGLQQQLDDYGVENTYDTAVELVENKVYTEMVSFFDKYTPYNILTLFGSSRLDNAKAFEIILRSWVKIDNSRDIPENLFNEKIIFWLSTQGVSVDENDDIEITDEDENQNLSVGFIKRKLKAYNVIKYKSTAQCYELDKFCIVIMHEIINNCKELKDVQHHLVFRFKNEIRNYCQIIKNFYEHGIDENFEEFLIWYKQDEANDHFQYYKEFWQWMFEHISEILYRVTNEIDDTVNKYEKAVEDIINEQHNRKSVVYYLEAFKKIGELNADIDDSQMITDVQIFKDALEFICLTPKPDIIKIYEFFNYIMHDGDLRKFCCNEYNDKTHLSKTEDQIIEVAKDNYEKCVELDLKIDSLLQGNQRIKNHILACYNRQTYMSETRQETIKKFIKTIFSDSFDESFNTKYFDKSKNKRCEDITSKLLSDKFNRKVKEKGGNRIQKPIIYALPENDFKIDMRAAGYSDEKVEEILNTYLGEQDEVNLRNKNDESLNFETILCILFEEYNDEKENAHFEITDVEEDIELTTFENFVIRNKTIRRIHNEN